MVCPDSLPRVHRLTATLANQIAAGEVVERPASVVKELLENSLDAGAREIGIDVERGGTRLIRVRDDGVGIHRDDLLLALARHATSKVATLDDLEQVTTLGFRGEALPSIASVSRLTITSRRAGEENGWRLRAEGGLPETQVEPTPHPPGTSVEVRDLFFNTPARRKFLRTEKTEFGHLQEIVKRIGLSHFDVAIRLRQEQKDVLNLRFTDNEAERRRRLAAACGAAFAKHALEVDFQAVGLSLRGWIADPEHSRSQADLQYFYLNGRIVRDKLVSHAIRQAYQDLLYPGRHPAYVLYLDLEPTQADVNVHPSKHEVRFRDGRLVHDFLFRSLSRALDTGAGPGHAAKVMPAGGHGLVPGRKGYAPTASRVREAMDGYAALTGPAPVEPGAGDRVATSLGRALGQVHGRYVLAQNQLGLVLVDMRAARRHLAYGRLKSALANGAVRSQPLLVPVAFSLPEDLTVMVEEKSAVLHRLGFDLVNSGPDSVTVHRVPASLREAEPQALVRTLLTALAEVAPEEPAEHVPESVLAALAEQSRMAPGEPTLDELDGLLRQVERDQENSEGRPVWVQLSQDELEALFGTLQAAF